MLSKMLQQLSLLKQKGESKSQHLRLKILNLDRCQKKQKKAKPATTEGGVTAEETAKPAEKAEKQNQKLLRGESKKKAAAATEAKPAIDESNRAKST